MWDLNTRHQNAGLKLVWYSDYKGHLKVKLNSLVFRSVS
jgi:hypothetical protein